MTHAFSKPSSPTHTFTHTYLEVKFFFDRKKGKKIREKILEENSSDEKISDMPKVKSKRSIGKHVDTPRTKLSHDLAEKVSFFRNFGEKSFFAVAFDANSVAKCDQWGHSIAHKFNRPIRDLPLPSSRES